MKKYLTVLCRWVSSFFAYESLETISLTRRNMFYLVNWGFTYTELMTMPLPQLTEFINLLIKERKRENGANEEEQDTVMREKIHTFDSIFRG